MFRITTLKKSRFFCVFIFLFLVFTAFNQDLHAQCAGEDSAFSFCSKETVQFIELFDLLGGNPQTGGSWTDDNQNRGLNTATGTLDTYRIMQGGIVEYTYTVSGNGTCTEDMATVTLTLGSYPGRNNANAVTCSNVNAVNLFQFSGSSPSPTQDGFWTGMPVPNGSLSGLNNQIFNAEAAGPGLYMFMYTVPGQGDCPSTFSTVMLEVVPAPVSGTFVQPIFCESDDLSAFTQFDLKELLVGEDDGGAWSETISTNEIDRPNDSVINIENLRNTLGPGTYGFTYTVNPINPTCSPSQTTVTILIEDVIDFSNTTFTLQIPDNDTNVICEDALPIEVNGTLAFNTEEIPDDTYTITYSVGNGTNSNFETLEIEVLEGTATFPINEEFLVDSGAILIEITQIIDPNTQNNCQVTLQGLTDGFTIVELPDISNSVFVVDEPLCIGGNALMTISDIDQPIVELLDGDYAVNFSITYQNSSQIINDTITINSGTGQLTIDSALLTMPGAYSLTLNSISNAVGCTTSTDLSSTFTLSPRPDVQTLELNISDRCEDEDIVVTLLDKASPSNLVEGTYDLMYTITGDTSFENIVVEGIVFSAATATFSIPSEVLDSGNYILTIDTFQNTLTGCSAENLNVLSTSFSVVAAPDLTATVLVIDPVCEGQPAIVTLNDTAANIPNANYSLTYSLTINGVSDTITTTIDFIGGNASFTIPAETIDQNGNYILILSGFENTALGCAAVGLPRELNFDVFENPSLELATMSIAPVCAGDIISAQINAPDLEDGDYTITYAINGANTLNATTVTININSGSANFTIPAGLLPNSGENTLLITDIQQNRPTASCTTTASLSALFTIHPNPILDDLSLSFEGEFCLGNAVRLSINSENGNLINGNYTVIYSLSRANTSTEQQAELEIVSEMGSFTIPSAILTNSGTTQIDIIRIEDQLTGCATTADNLNTIFKITPPPDATNATINITDGCQDNAPFSVNISAPNLENDLYSFSYTLSGANVGNGTATDVSMANGIGSFTLNTSLLTITGETTITINTISSQTCITENLEISDTFFIFSTPEIQDENLEIPSVCLGENTQVALKAQNLEDGTYVLTYSLSGANVVDNESITLTILNGNASFILAASTIDNAGSNIFKVELLSNTTSGCSTLQNATTSFEVYAIPTITENDLTAFDVCLGEDGLVTLNAASGLPDTSYTVRYMLSGANTSIANTATFTINGGAGNLTIPGALLNTVGATTITLQEIISAEGCTSGLITVETSFDVIPRPDATDLMLNVEDNCLGNEFEVNMYGATLLDDGDYILSYELSGANNSQNQEINIQFSNGNASFTIDASLLSNAGNTSVTIMDIQDFATQCGAMNIDDTFTTFSVQDPDPPILATNGGLFCINENPTIADLINRLSPTMGIFIYDSETGKTNLDPSALLENGTTYYASFRDSSTGCESSVRLAITADLTGCDSIFVPQGFSPNGDGVNDFFTIENIDVVYPNYSIEIFNRNGNVVFKGRAGQPQWDGTANQSHLGNNFLPNGTYFYIINYNDGQTTPLQGNVYLNR